jgi:hypothetical protein
MDAQFSIGKIVWVYRTGSEGEIIKTVDVDHQTKYHVRVPSENETFMFGSDDLFPFGEMAQDNIRKEWANAAC